MALTPGTKLGPYEIQSPLGAGGMGEVYRAHDLRLDRTVAIKILPLHLSEKPEAKERFDREARALSSLSHPNICHLYDVGQQDGISYLVMEYLEGETLADRLRKGPLMLEQVLRVAAEICEGLEKAHRGGVVHRDLKPGNIMLTKSGAKLMDFGLAKAAIPPVGAGSSSDSLATMSGPLTTEGTIVGTIQYMSPEQVEGKEADARSDIFSFGAVLYELITGKRAFEGKTAASTIAAILAVEPKPISTLRPMSPPAFERVVKACLAKDPDERFQTVHDLKMQLHWIADGSSQLGAQAGAHKDEGQRGWIIAAIAVATLCAGLALAYFVRPVPERLVIRSSILPPENTTFAENSSEWASAAVSPDGLRIVAGVVGQANREMLYVHPLNALTGQILAGTEGATFPFWSPDSRTIGFFADGQLKTIEASGGPVQGLCPAPQARGGSWSKGGVIVFAPSPLTGLFRVAATGGAAAAITKLDSSRREDSHRWPQFLPDGRHFLYLARTSERSGSEIRLSSVDAAEPVSIVRADGNPVYAAAGFLLYPKGNALVAQPFDADHFRISGEPVTIADQVSANGNVDFSSFSVSANGVLAYKGAVGEGVSELIWMDRSGKILEKVGEPGGYFGPRLSPDGRKLAVEINDPHNQANSDIWIYDLIRNSKARLTFSQRNEHNGLPVWSPDGNEIVFNSDRGGHGQQIYEKAVSGKDPEHVVSPGEGDRYPGSWSPDGHYLAGVQQSAQRGTEFLVLSMLGTQKPIDFLPGAVGLNRFAFPQISPNGKWIAYASFETGRGEIYISSFPSGSGKWQVSTTGANGPIWRRDGKELFYVTFGETLMSAEIAEERESPGVGKIQPLFRIHRAPSPNPVYDASPDGKRFLINSPVQPSTPEPIRLVVNWDAELKRK